MTIEFNEARSRAQEYVDSIQGGLAHEIIVLDSRVTETSDAWYFPYNGREFVENGDFSAALAGNLPVRISKADGSFTLQSPPRGGPATNESDLA